MWQHEDLVASHLRVSITGEWSSTLKQPDALPVDRADAAAAAATEAAERRATARAGATAAARCGSSPPASQSQTRRVVVSNCGGVCGCARGSARRSRISPRA